MYTFSRISQKLFAKTPPQFLRKVTVITTDTTYVCKHTNKTRIERYVYTEKSEQ